MRRVCLFVFLGFYFSTLADAQTQELILPVALNGYTIQPVHYQTTISHPKHVAIGGGGDA